ncbi:pleckstrin homology domain-containing family S member 1-like [Scleropages formosus]|uniref:Pleckstrin homology domain containing S1, tandem duplicate 3 n=1 Tax=Scleropages formosus TaxID=113540 RepID=A0A8C9SH60_SCLFO|nr:pleckstrin homology domain-containing family S member 1 [Scleropages formosus]
MPGKGHQRSTGTKAVFYTPVAGVEEVRTGQLLKSPPQNRFKNLGSWKHRFFVLFKTKEDTYLLKYFRSEDERDKVKGGIDIAKISSIQPCPNKHPKWEWIERTFRCPADCVLFIETRDREYFLIAENRARVRGWYIDICNAMMNLSSPHTSPEDPHLPGLTQNLDRGVCRPKPSIGKLRSLSEPMPHSERHVITRPKTLPSRDWGTQTRSEKLTPTAPPRPDDEDTTHYITPRAVLEAISQDNGDDEDDSEEENSFYMKMDKLREILDEDIYENIDLEKEGVKKDRQQMSLSMATKTLDIQKMEMNSRNWCDEVKRNSGDSLDSGCLYSGASSSSLTDDTSDLQTDGASGALKLLEDPVSSDEAAPVEKEIILDQTDVREHLKLEEIDGRPCITQWTAPSESTCKFHQGDRVLAVNDLETNTVADVEMYLCKLLKKTMRLTIQRLPGSKSFHADYCCCD